MALKIKRGSGAPSVTLLEGEPYLDIDNGNIYVGDGSENKQHNPTVGKYFSLVNATGTPAENGAALLAEYARVKALGLTLDADTRYTIYIPAGQYDLASELTVDTAYIDVVSLNGEKSVHLTTNTINVTADYVNVTGINVGSQQFKGCDNLANIVITNCGGSSYSFGGFGTASGTFKNCTGTFGSFGGFGTASGTFTNCTGGDSSFGGGYQSTASGTFTNCTGGNQSFGGGAGIASGTFTNCTGGNQSFGGDAGIASGTFKNCTGNFGSFGGNGGTASGIFLWCRVTEGPFPVLGEGGIQRMCLNADYTEVNAPG